MLMTLGDGFSYTFIGVKNGTHAVILCTQLAILSTITMTCCHYMFTVCWLL
mgnify:FL=1